MNANEIKKALKGSILNAKSVNSKVWSIEICKLEQALDLINQYEAEMQHYKEKLHNRKSEVNRLNSKVKSLKYNLKTAKAEAIKEFAERLKEDVCVLIQDHKEIFAGVSIDDIDARLKEMGVE